MKNVLGFVIYSIQCDRFQKHLNVLITLHSNNHDFRALKIKS